MNKNLVIAFLIFIAIISVTFVIILFGKGYRFGFNTGKIEFNGTGLLVAKSLPDGAQVFVNDHLTTATNNTINLAPGEYTVKIFKEGYFPWEKKIKIQEEVVSRAEALLIPAAPKLESITEVGVNKAVVDPTLTKIAFTVSSQSAKRNGVYVFDLTGRNILTLQNLATQIADDNSDLFSEAELSWTPDGKNVIATVSARTGFPSTYLLDPGRLTTPSDVTATLPSLTQTWARQKATIDRALLNSLPASLRRVVTANFKIIAWSPDDTKILYSASKSGTLPLIINPRVIGVNPTPEQRTIEEGSYYVYDVKEDRNYKLPPENFKSAFNWFADSAHIIYIKDKEVHIMEYEGGNDTTVYAGPFKDGYIFSWPDATRIVILTNLGNSKILPNLYTISLK